MLKHDFSWANPHRNEQAFIFQEIQLLNKKIETLTSLISNIKPKQKEFLTRRETADLCNVKSLSTLWNWEKQGLLIPKMKAGRKPLYLRQDVINFLNTKS